MNAMKHELLTLEIESGLKTELERVCHKLGMNISTAFAILARKFIREQETSSGRLSDDLFIHRLTSLFIRQTGTAYQKQNQMNLTCRCWRKLNRIKTVMNLSRLMKLKKY